MAVDTLILDLGNVLVWHDNALLFDRLAQRANKDPAWVARALMGPGWLAANRGELDGEGIRRMVCGILETEIPMAEFEPLWSCHFKVDDQVVAIVERLEGVVKRVLLSNTNTLHVRWIRPRLPLLERFEHVLFSNEVGMVKPERELYQEALRRAGTRPEQAAFFDDQREYVEAARAVGIQAEVFQDAETFVSQLRSLGLPV